MAFQGQLLGGNPPGSPPAHLVGGYRHMALFDGVPGAPSRSSERPDAQDNDLSPMFEQQGDVGVQAAVEDLFHELGVAPLSFESAPHTPEHQFIPHEYSPLHASPSTVFDSPGSVNSEATRADLVAQANLPSPIRHVFGEYGALALGGFGGMGGREDFLGLGMGNLLEWGMTVDPDTQ